MPKRSFKEQYRYYFDNLMSKGTLSIIGFLAIVSLVFISIFTIVLWLIKIIPGKGFAELFWLNIFKVLNTGILDDAAPGQLNFFLSLVIALVSIFIISLLIGLLTAGIQQKIWSLRKGRSKVIEAGHTIILGWSEIVFPVIKSLMEANKNQRKYKIVIMGDKDKVEMEDGIRERIKKARNTRIICRQGNPVNMNDLKIVNLFQSKSVVILENKDSTVLKTILAINNSRTQETFNPPNIVAMLNESNNLDSGRIAGEGHTSFILNQDFISRLIAQTCYQPGLSLVYNHLLSFEGDEIYISNLKELYGKTFKETLFMFEDSTVIGIRSNGVVMLNPPGDTAIKENDSIIAISEDDNTILLSGIEDHGVDEEAISLGNNDEKRTEKILILGWNEKTKIVIDELKKYISPDSTISVLADFECIGDLEDIKKTGIELINGDINDNDLLSGIIQKNFDHIVVLAYHGLEIQEADAITLMALIHLRNIAKKSNNRFSVTSEMLDINNRELAKVAKVNDFIVSENITSLLLAQISENASLGIVFDELLDEAGSEIYLKNIKNYINTKKPVNFYTVQEAAQRRGETAIGYKINTETDEEDKNFGIYINPAKSGYVSFSEDDDLIVLASI